MFHLQRDAIGRLDVRIWLPPSLPPYIASYCDDGLNGNENDCVMLTVQIVHVMLYCDPTGIFIECTGTDHGGACMLTREETCSSIRWIAECRDVSKYLCVDVVHNDAHARCGCMRDPRDMDMHTHTIRNMKMGGDQSNISQQRWRNHHDHVYVHFTLDRVVKVRVNRLECKVNFAPWIVRYKGGVGLTTCLSDGWVSNPGVESCFATREVKGGEQCNDFSGCNPWLVLDQF
jgi:hypothetical protein